MKAPLLVVNPACGARSTRALSQVLTAVERRLGDTVIRYTTRRGHASELAAEGTRAGYELIVAVGGDGTLSEVVTGVLSTGESTQPSVGLINLGTGGDFRRALGISPGYERSLEVLALGRERAIDVGRVTLTASNGETLERYFVNVLSAGLGGLVDHYIDVIPNAVGGRLAYYLATVAAVITGRERRVIARITWQGETREETIPAYLVAVCNGRWFGGGMDIAPMALTDDGRLEVVTITERNRLFLLAKSRTVYTGRHLDEPTVRHSPCERIELRLENEAAERRFLLDVDGEPLGSLPVAVEILPGRLKIRA